MLVVCVSLFKAGRVGSIFQKFACGFHSSNVVVWAPFFNVGRVGSILNGGRVGSTLQMLLLLLCGFHSSRLSVWVPLFKVGLVGSIACMASGAALLM